MATFYGLWVGGDDWRAALDATVENTSSTTCTVRLVGWIYNVYAVASNFGAYITTDKNGGTTYYAVGSISEGSGWKRINGSDITFTVDRGTSDKTVSVQCIIYGSGIYSGSSSNAAGSVTIPKIPTENPNAPSGASATYISDSSITVAWTNGSTSTTKPRTATLVERSTDGGSWVQIASAGSSATSYADNGVSANHSYAYRVCASNSAGKSGYSTTGTVYTTPAAPSSVVLSKMAQTTVQLDVEGAAPYATAYRVELTHDGGSTWEVVEASTSLPITVDVGGGTAQFRVASLNGTLQSAWTLSESIVTICPPLAPTIVQQPANPTALGGACTVAWTPNHPDGTSQTAAQVKLTRPSGTTSTVDLTTAKTYSFTPNLTGTYSMQVRTKGLDADWGEWSSTVSWGVYALPIVTIASPAVDDAELHAMPLTVSWSVTDPTGVSTQRVVVSDSAGTQIYNRTQGASVRSVGLTDSDVALQNGGEYSITVRVMGGSGLIAEAVRTFIVDWTPPAIPVLQIAEGAGASAQIVVENVQGGKNRVVNILTGLYINGNTSVVKASDGATIAVASVEQNTDYTLSYTGGNRCIIAGFAENDIAAGSTGTVINNQVSRQSPKTFNSGEHNYIACFVATSAASVSSIQVEKGTEATDYEEPIPDTESVTVQRANADGTAWTVAANLPLGGTCIDPLPPLGVEVEYVATASAASGATASGRYTATIGGRTWALNAGAAAQEHMELRYNPQASYAMGHGGEAYHFADGGAGGGRPVFYPTTDRDESGTLKFDTVDKDDTDALRAMSDRNPVMWLRDPFGHRWRAHVRPSSSHGMGRIWQLGIAWDAVRMEEAW